MSTLLSAALSYATIDLHVFPLIPRAKRPNGLLAPHGVDDASIDSHRIRRDWTREPDGNIGIAIGVGSLFGVRVFDVDPKHGGDRELARLIAKHGSLPTTPTQRSGSGGLHVLMRWPSGNWKTKLIHTTSGLELLGPGRYFVAAPSTHPDTGKQYEWIIPITQTIAPAPAWLQELAVHRETALRAPVGITPTGPAYARGALISAMRIVETAPNGERNNELNKQAFALSRFVRSGELEANLVRRALLDAASVAGLPALEAERTISSALRARKAQA